MRSSGAQTEGKRKIAWREIVMVQVLYVGHKQYYISLCSGLWFGWLDLCYIITATCHKKMVLFGAHWQVGNNLVQNKWWLKLELNRFISLMFVFVCVNIHISTLAVTYIRFHST